MAKSVLICDDAAFMRVMIKDILTKNGYEVVGEAENGQKAVEKYLETKPDLVMMVAVLYQTTACIVTYSAMSHFIKQNV